LAVPPCYARAVAVRRALFFSDIHLGWVPCSRHHAAWLSRLPQAVDDAELVVLNGDIVDGHRRVHRPSEAELVQRLGELVVQWRREGREVVYVEGNHDRDLGPSAPFRPDRWHHAFEVATGERVLALHGHRFSPSTYVPGLYERSGRRILLRENRAYARLPLLRSLYGLGPGLVVAAIGATECFVARRTLPSRLTPLLRDVDVVLHGHIHFGPGRGAVGGRPTWRTGAWVSSAQPGAADRMLRYRAGRFERITWSRGAWRAAADNR
jgi:UDP-2,3-diacylglucosamine pyrophosphatase LpxH